MFRHVVLFGWTPTATQAQKDEVRSGLTALPAAIPAIRRLSLGDDTGFAEDNYDMALVVDFDGPDAYREYADDPQHRRLINDRIRPILQRRAAVQYLVEE